MQPVSNNFSDSRLSEDGTNRLKTLLKNLPGMAYRCLNLDHWPMSFVSDGCYDLCGYHRHEIVNQTILWGDFTHPDDLLDLDRKVRTAAMSDQPFEVEYRIITRGGEEKWVWERGRVVDHREDGVAIIDGFITDITDRKLAETALVQAEAFAQAVVASAVEAVITIDDQGAIESFNPATREMFGYNLESIYLDHSRLLVPTRYFREFENYLMYGRDHPDNHAIGGELCGIKKDGSEFPVEIGLNPIVTVDGLLVLASIIDITTRQRRKELERTRREQGIGILKRYRQCSPRCRC